MSPADIFCKLFGRFVRPDLEPNHLTLWLYFWKNFRKSYSADEENSFVFCRLQIFRWTFLKQSFMDTIRVPNSLDSDQAWRFVGSYLVQTACEDYHQTTKVKIVIFLLAIQNQRCHLHAMLSLCQIWTQFKSLFTNLMHNQLHS